MTKPKKTVASPDRSLERTDGRTLRSEAIVLVPLIDAIAPYRGVSLRSVREWIKSGKLPASKVGRNYLVDPADVAALLRPTLRTSPPPGKRPRESEKGFARQ